MPRPTRFILAVTGASGMAYVPPLARALAAAGELHLIVSSAAHKVLAAETGGAFEELLLGIPAVLHADDDMASPLASGSWRHDGMAVCPCSMASLAAIAQGQVRHLVHRAADVALKEGARLVLVPRETPLSRIHLTNMLAAAEAGAVILPACPGFWGRPQTIEDLCAFLAGRVMDALGLEHGLGPRWGQGDGE